MKRLVLAILAGAASTVAAAAFGAEPAAKESCFWTRDLRNHRIADRRTLYFYVAGRDSVAARDVYRVVTDDNCLAGTIEIEPMVLRDRAATGQICNRMDLDISVRGARCIVSSLTKLTPAEVAALPKRLRP